MKESSLPRIARILDTTPATLCGLKDLPEDDLRVLAAQISKSLFEQDSELFRRSAAASKILPSKLAGKLAERFMPPLLAARTAEHLSPEKARDLIGTVSVPYLADIAMALDPARMQNVVSDLPAKRIGQVAEELFRRDELSAMADFVGTVTNEALLAALEVATGTQLLRVVPMLEWSEQLESVIDQVSDEKIDALLSAVVDESLWTDAVYLLERLQPSSLRRVAERLAHASADVVDSIRASRQAGILPESLYDALAPEGGR